MSDLAPHPIDAIQEALDVRLSAAQRSDLDAHLATCARCRREFATLAWTKTQTAGMRVAVAIPAQLDAPLIRALDTVDAAETRRHGGGARALDLSRIARGWWPAAAALAAAVLLLVWWARPPSAGQSAVEQVAEDYRAFRGGQLALGVETRDEAEVEAYFNRGGLPFTMTVADFSATQHDIAGGVTHRLSGRPAALFVYRNRSDIPIICQMFQGRLQDLPAPDQRLIQRGAEFLVYTRGEITAVFWQEDDLTCVLVGDHARDVMVRLAFAKTGKI